MLSWLAHWIERHASIHRVSLRIWRLFPPRLAGFLKGRFARSWVVGAVAIMVDGDASPPEVLLVQHSYRRRGSWGLPGGSLESIPGSATTAGSDPSPDDVVEATLRREVWEELGIEVSEIEFLRIDAVPYIAEEPGPDRLDFYFLCTPAGGFARLRQSISSGEFKPRSPEIEDARLVPLPELTHYDVFSTDARLLQDDLPRLRPKLAVPRSDGQSTEPARGEMNTSR